MYNEVIKDKLNRQKLQRTKKNLNILHSKVKCTYTINMFKTPHFILLIYVWTKFTSLQFSCNTLNCAQNETAQYMNTQTSTWPGYTQESYNLGAC
jgi:hypothetical protein